MSSRTTLKVVPGLIAVVGVAGLVACGSAGTAPFRDSAETPTTSSGGSGASPDAGRVTDPPIGGTNAVDGVLLVHASYNLPPFRACFDGRDSKKPAPDTKLMPQSNLIGLEVGSAAHIGTLRDGKEPATSNVRLFLETSLRNRPSSTCQQLLADPSLVEGTHKWTVPFNSDGLFAKPGVYLLAIEGCIAQPGAALTTELCGQQFTSANVASLRANVVALSTPPKDSSGFYAQALVLSDAAQAAGKVEISFGPLAAGVKPFAGNLKLPVPQPATPQSFDFPPDVVSAYASHGFRVGINGTTKLEQSLAATQNLTDPQKLPTEFYTFPSNFVVLLLGDPSAPSTDTGRGLHVIAVPVRNPDAPIADAGSDGDR